MDVYAGTSVNLGDSARRPGEAGRRYNFEIAAALCVALIGATAWAVLAADWVHGGGGAIVVAITSVIEAALLAQARAPRITSRVEIRGAPASSDERAGPRGGGASCTT